MASEVLGVVLAVNPSVLEETYRSREIARTYRVEAPIAIRLDGVGWGHKLIGFEWPRDERVHRSLIDAAVVLLRELAGCCALATSDEINVIMPGPLPYSGRVEKLDSISASIAAAVVSQKLSRTLFFDARVVKLYTAEDAHRYLVYRARVGFNNYTSQLYHKHYGSKERTPSLKEMILALEEIGESPLKEPPWKTLGTCVAFASALKSIGGVRALRRRILAIDGGLELCEKALRETWRASSS